MKSVVILATQPRDPTEAKSWLHWFALHGYTVSVGLIQVNAEMAPQLHVRPEQLVEPCTKRRVGAPILVSLYTDVAGRIGEGFQALNTALSLYYTGDFDAGFRNGYVARVYADADRRAFLLLK